MICGWADSKLYIDKLYPKSCPSYPFYNFLLEYIHTHSFIYCLWVALCYCDRIESLQLHGFQNLKYLLWPYATPCLEYNHLGINRYFFFVEQVVVCFTQTLHDLYIYSKICTSKATGKFLKVTLLAGGQYLNTNFGSFFLPRRLYLLCDRSSFSIT